LPEVVHASPPPEPVAPPILLPSSAVAPVPDPGNRPPEYPEALRAQGVGGTVLLKIALSATGTVEDVQVLSGNRALAEAAVEAAREWRYSPALVEGRPTAVYFVVRVPFRERER
jgi:TonB family protein